MHAFCRPVAGRVPGRLPALCQAASAPNACFEHVCVQQASKRGSRPLFSKNLVLPACALFCRALALHSRRLLSSSPLTLCRCRLSLTRPSHGAGSRSWCRSPVRRRLCCASRWAVQPVGHGWGSCAHERTRGLTASPLSTHACTCAQICTGARVHKHMHAHACGSTNKLMHAHAGAQTKTCTHTREHKQKHARTRRACGPSTRRTTAW